MSQGHPLTPDRWELVQSIFHDVLEQPPERWDALLDEACGGDPSLRREVASLLASHHEGGVIEVLDADPQPLRADPERVGDYRIIELLGEGGMGSVYLARRESPGFTQTVALKLMRAGFADPRLHNRLLLERRILAGLEHPGIARLIDGGATDAGQPYYAMEYVEGTSLLAYCDDNALTIGDRLRLFSDICEAVHYAHQQLVVHRDLKPNNILVTPDGRPKLLDFGIAKLLDPSQGLEQRTQTVPWFTPLYASPEQVRGDAVGTPSDIYALGVLLYEMLTGRPPYEVDSRSPAEIERIVCHQVPDRPSTVVGRTASPPPAAGDTPTGSGDRAARTRGGTVDRLKRRLAGDIDTIVMKALAKEPSRRYASAEQFADDVRRHLDGRPVLARPDTLRYRAAKFIRRHRTAAAVGAVALAILVAGVAAVVWQARRATEQAAIASDQAEKTALVAGLMVDLFRLSDPTETLGDTITARQMLDRGTARIEREFGDQPDVQATLFTEVARVYANIGLLSRAETLVQRAVALQEALYGPASVELSESVSQLGQLLSAQGKQEEAVARYRQAIGIREAVVPLPDSLLAQTRANLAWELRAQGAYEAAAALFTTALEEQRALFPEGPQHVAGTLLGLAATLHDQGSFDDAEELFRTALARHDTAGARPHPMAATALFNIGMLRRLREQYVPAEPLLRSALAMRAQLYEPDHPDVLEAVDQWGSELTDLGRYAEAEPVLRDGLARSLDALGPDHTTTGSIRGALAHLLNRSGRYVEAAAHYDTAIAVKRRRYEGDHASLMFSLLWSGEPLLRGGETERARERFAEALAMSGRLSGTPSVSRLLALDGLAQIAMREGDLEAAGAMLAEAQALAAELLREDHRYTLRVRRTEAARLLEAGMADSARAVLERVVAAEREVLPEPHPNIGRTLQDLGAADLAAGLHERARQTLERALANLAGLPPSHWRVGEVKSLLGVALRAQGRDAEADALIAEGLAIVEGHLGPGAPETRRARGRMR